MIMFGTLAPGIFIDDEDEDDVKTKETSIAELVQPGDIVEIAVRDRRPVLTTSNRYDCIAGLRILGITSLDEQKYFLMLVTDYDETKIKSTLTVNEWVKLNYDVEDRFVGCRAIEVSDLHVREIQLKQRGRFCDVCTEYNPDVRIPKEDSYRCPTCRLNPYR